MSIPIYTFGVGPLGTNDISSELEVDISENTEEVAIVLADNTETLVLSVECQE